ncbi:MAG: sulfatase-like hydrolase/transferase [Polyangiales bacterium]
MRRAVFACVGVLGVALGGGCGRKGTPADANDAAITAASATPLPATDPTDVALDMLIESPRCRVEHRGALIDLGTAEAAWSTPGHPDATTDFPALERDGVTWGRVLDRSQTFNVAFEASGAALVSLRGRAKGAKKVVASVDGKVVGTLLLSATEDKVVTVSNSAVVLAPGAHTLTLRWLGTVKKEEPLAEIDWIRVGTDDGDAAAYAAPTRKDTVNEVVIGGAPRRAYTLRAPAVLRCVAWVPAGAVLAADVGTIGEGNGEVELRERATGDDPARVLVKQVTSGTSWTGVSTKLGVGGEAGSIAVLEIAVIRAPKQGRIAIAEPRIVDAAPHTMAANVLAKPSSPQRVVVIVMAGLTVAGLELPSLKKLAREGVVFRAHRAPSSLASASVASLVSGLPVPVHALEDAGARLSPSTPLIGKLLGPFGVESAMFTEAPTTGPAFGFAHDWGHYAARSPLDGPPVAFAEVLKFLESNAGKKTFVLAHARGAHPPWEVTSEALKSLPPEGYNGLVDPKHVVAVVSKARRNLLRLTEADRTRLLALEHEGLGAQDQQLDALIEDLRAHGTLDGTMIIVTSDAPFVIPPATAKITLDKGEKPAPDAVPTTPPPPPPAPEPTEDPLAIPLVIRFPKAFAQGRVVTAMSEPTDVAATIAAAFGAPTSDLAGRDLATLAVDDERARDTARLLDDGRGYQLAWGDLRLVGAWGKAPALRVRLALEDLRTKRPYEYLAAWGLAALERGRWLAARAKGPGREPATVDAATAAAMDTWERTK